MLGTTAVLPNEGRLPNQPQDGSPDDLSDFHERNRRARTLRMFLLMILFLLLSDPETPPPTPASVAADKTKIAAIDKPTPEAFDQRVKLNNIIAKRVRITKRYNYVMNHNAKVPNGTTNADPNADPNTDPNTDPNDSSPYLHYPHNVTGTYRGSWSTLSATLSPLPTLDSSLSPPTVTAVPAGIGVYALATLQGNFVDLANRPLNRTMPPTPPRPPSTPPTTLSSKSGSLALHLTMKHITGISTFSLLRGYVKLYNGITQTSADVVVAVSGIVAHDTGVVTLVGNNPEPAILLGSENAEENGGDDPPNDPTDHTPVLRRVLADLLSADEAPLDLDLDWSDDESWPPYFSSLPLTPTRALSPSSLAITALPLSLFPFSTPTVVSPTEKQYVINGGGCSFEFTLNAHTEQLSAASLAVQDSISTQLATAATSLDKTDIRETWVNSLSGSVHSRACSLNFNLTATAVRIDFDTLTDRAVNYSIVMTFVCLTQIVLLLKQLHHSQTSSAASRVSMLGIGMQAVIDSLGTLFHISLALFIQNLFTAFLSIVFFKLLIFGIIELKYLSIIQNARHPNATGEDQRRHVTLLYAQFYLAFFATLSALFLLADSPHLLGFTILLLYSFWVPQIILNITTEARKPLNMVYVGGITCSRMFLPVYVFGYGGNFLSFAIPGMPVRSPLMAFLCLWMALQAGVLYLQSKWGARFMIPARFLPPKFDYSRELPKAMRQEEEADLELGDVSETTRLRSDSGEQHGSGEQQGTVAELECVICYDSVDPRDRKKYMLAPCDHIFHKDCLVQWMDVKMECPVCRGPLPEM